MGSGVQGFRVEGPDEGSTRVTKAGLRVFIGYMGSGFRVEGFRL